MRTWLFLFLLFLQPELQVVRDAYEKATVSRDESFALYDLLDEVSENDDVRLVAYKGAAITLVSRFEEKVKSKIVRFREGTALIDWAASKAPNDLEVRFVRLSVQQHAPKFLKYDTHILADKEFVFRQLKLLKSPGLKTYIRNYILNSDKFTAEEKARIASR